MEKENTPIIILWIVIIVLIFLMYISRVYSKTIKNFLFGMFIITVLINFIYSLYLAFTDKSNNKIGWSISAGLSCIIYSLSLIVLGIAICFGLNMNNLKLDMDTEYNIAEALKSINENTNIK